MGMLIGSTNSIYFFNFSLFTINNETKKVLILTNPLNHEGGIVNYYNLFLNILSPDITYSWNNWFKSLFVFIILF